MARKWTDNEEILGPQFDAALDARHRGDIPKAMALCHELLEQLTISDRILFTGVHNELGFIYRTQSDYERAVMHFRKATEVSPRSELSSLGLYHSLFNQDLVEDALREAVRFLELRDSAEYRSMLTAEGAYRDDLLAPERALADRARQLLALHLTRS